jgi:hypothetical protein
MSTLRLADLGYLGALKPASAYDADALAWFTAVELTGATFGPNAGAIALNKLAFSTFWAGCKADGIDEAIQQLIFLRGVSTLVGTLVPFKGPAPTNILFVQGSLNPATGMVGNNTSQSLDLNVSNSSTPQNDSHNAVWIVSIGGDGGQIGSAASAAGINRISRFGGLFFIRNRNLSATSIGAGTANFLGVSRNNESNCTVRNNNTTQTIAQASQAPDSGNLTAFSFGDGAYSGGRMAAISNGTNLNLALLDARLTTLFNTLTWP